tara:strand:- start:442 stop:717 length:276 start_codon:yes stop_codon:yes gene_type:complete
MNLNIFSHIILTGFNVSGLWNMDKNNNKILDESWTKHRFEIFEKYFLPSINNQTNNNFKWLVYFDINTKTPFKKRIKNLELKYSFFLSGLR